MRTPSFLACALAALSLTLGASAQTAVTPVFGAAVVPIAGASGGARITFFSLTFTQPVVYAGEVSGWGNSTVSDSLAEWTSGQFVASPPSHYLEVTSGPNAGAMASITGINPATDTLTLSDNLSALPGMATGVTYAIRPYATIASVFGPASTSTLTGGESPEQADEILVLNNTTKAIASYWRSTVPGFEGWFDAGFNPAENVPLEPEQGLMVRRKTAGEVSLIVSGQVKTGATIIPIAPGYNIVGTLKAAGSTRLADLQLDASGFVAGDSPEAGDSLLVYASNGQGTTYWLSNVPGFTGWFDASYTPADNVTIAAGTAFFVIRKTGSFNWTAPAP